MNVWVEEGRRGWTDDRAISFFGGVEEGPVTCDITETSLTPSAGGGTRAALRDLLRRLRIWASGI